MPPLQRGISDDLGVHGNGMTKPIPCSDPAKPGWFPSQHGGFVQVSAAGAFVSPSVRAQQEAQQQRAEGERDAQGFEAAQLGIGVHV